MVRIDLRDSLIRRNNWDSMLDGHTSARHKPIAYFVLKKKHSHWLLFAAKKRKYQYVECASMLLNLCRLINRAAIATFSIPKCRNKFLQQEKTDALRTSALPQWAYSALCGGSFQWRVRTQRSWSSSITAQSRVVFRSSFLSRYHKEHKPRQHQYRWPGVPSSWTSVLEEIKQTSNSFFRLLQQDILSPRKSHTVQKMIDVNITAKHVVRRASTRFDFQLRPEVP